MTHYCVWYQKTVLLPLFMSRCPECGVREKKTGREMSVLLSIYTVRTAAPSRAQHRPLGRRDRDGGSQQRENIK